MSMKTVSALGTVHRGPDFIVYEVNERRGWIEFRHALNVNCSISAFGFDVTVLLLPHESDLVEAGNQWDYFADRAREMQDRPTEQDAVKLEGPNRT